MIQFQYNDGGRSQHYSRKSEGDCVVRAISIALGQDYRKTYLALIEEAKKTGDFPNHRAVYERYLKSHGWVRQRTVRTAKGRKIRLRGWNAPGITALVHTTSHLTAVVNGVVNDIWDCREWCMNSWYVDGRSADLI